ncbi:EamA family transporter [Halobaculum rubrum]|uniref:EamA family transporter n=1 Tax=Halobaculum rubrum TaxID=2872158 RepID=UPI001CA3CEB4|nr:EamA family transporter [Halobaculum rubrum]QZY00162.1 EamA family transporter [Halobaculum rubrum]
MSYLLWTVAAMISYAFSFLFIKIATNDLPPFTVMPIAIVTLAVGSTVVAALFGEWSAASLTSRSVQFSLAAGVCLAGAVVGYFRALSTGPVSVVVPVFGLFLVVGAILGIVVLGEPVTIRKALGIVLAGVAVVLLAS